MSIPRLHFALLAIALLASGAWADDLPPPETVRAQLKTVAIMPMVVPNDVPQRVEVQHRFELALEARFAAAGIQVIPASAMAELQAKVRTALGGFYDPQTGEPDKARAEMFDEHVWSEFRRLHPADAWVYSTVELRRAAAGGAWMEWDGVQESAIGSAEPMKDMFKAPSAQGGLPAISLLVLVVRPDRQPLYGRYGGLQPMAYFGESSFAKSMMMVPQQISMVQVDPESVLADPARDQRAIALALDPLLLTQAERDAAKETNKAAWKQIKPVPIGAPKQKAPEVDRAAFLARYPRVAVAAAEVPKIPNRSAARERYTAAVTTALTQAGFEVIPPTEYAAVWDPIYASAGGFYDPLTGDFLAEKRKAAIAEAFAKLGAASPVDAVFLPALVRREARIDKGEAKWDGLSIPLGKGGALFDKSRQFGGTMPAMSLELRALDKDLNEVFLGRGGIELLERFKVGGLMSMGGFEEIPDADWLADSAKDAPATERALGALAAPRKP